jgi:glycosyltransferase involved in cell wall biosynthesis
MHVLVSAVSSSKHPTGICRHAANLARCLAARDEVSRVTLLVGDWQVTYFKSAFRLKNPRLEIVPINVANRSFERNLWYWRGLPKQVEAHGPDIVHLSFPIPFVRSRFPCPVVSSLHDLYPYDIPSTFGFPRVVFNRLFLRQCCRNSDLIVCVSEFTLSRLRALMPRVAAAKAIRVYQCVQIDPTKTNTPLLPEVLGRPFLLAVAQHRRNKNLGLLLLAFANLCRRNEPDSELCLVVVGSDGPETGRLQYLIRRLSLQGHIVLKASVTDSELLWLYENCILFIAPSSIEGFGLPVVEALQCGSRVLCSDIPAFREVGGAACHYFHLESESPAIALADAAHIAMQGPARKPERFDRFSARVIAAQYVAAYSNLIAGGMAFSDASTSLSTQERVHYDSFAT